jgi:hypothetical protein
MATDMSLGGGAGFGAGYTPIRFAPLVSLTGPIQGPATPTAPEAAPAAPMIRPPVYQGDAGDYGGMPATYYGGPPIGERSRGALQADMANAAGFLMSPFSAMANYVLTGQTPAMQFGIGDQREALGLQQSDVMPQGLMPQGGNPFAGFLQGLQDSFARNVFGPEEVPLFETRAPMQTAVPSMVFDGGLYSVTPELSPIEQTNALFNDPAFYNAIVAGVPVGQMQQSNMSPILEALNQSILQGTSTMEQFGPQETGGGFAPSDFGGVGVSAPEGSTAFGDASSGAYGYI